MMLEFWPALLALEGSTLDSAQHLDPEPNTFSQTLKGCCMGVGVGFRVERGIQQEMETTVVFKI